MGEHEISDGHGSLMELEMKNALTGSAPSSATKSTRYQKLSIPYF